MTDQGFANMGSSRQDVDISLQPVGGVSGDSAKETVVMIAESVMEEVRRHGSKNTSREQGGVLVGTVASSRDKVYVTVEGSIPAPHARADRTSVTFTHESWAEINQVKDAEHSNQDIVGWYHTHPGFGVFLSDYDTFIHRNFFPAPWQVAFVLDPLSQQSGLFVWKEGEIVPSDQYNVFSTQVSARPEPPAETPPFLPTEQIEALPRPANLVTIAALLVLVLQVVLLVMMLTTRPGRSVMPADTGAGAVVARLEAVQGELTASTATLEQLAAKLGERGEAVVAEPGWYEVKRGDSLWGIAERHYGKGELYTLIAAENKIPLPAGNIVPGQRLRLPRLAEGSDAATE